PCPGALDALRRDGERNLFTQHQVRKLELLLDLSELVVDRPASTLDVVGRTATAGYAKNGALTLEGRALAAHTSPRFASSNSGRCRGSVTRCSARKRWAASNRRLTVASEQPVSSATSSSR